MSTLFVLRSEPDERVRELIQAVTEGEVTTIALYESPTDYDALVRAIFDNERVICWW